MATSPAQFPPHARFLLQWPDSMAANLLIAGVLGFCILSSYSAPHSWIDKSLPGWRETHLPTTSGWELFRQDPRLHWPLTFTDRLGYPLGDSIAFMDRFRCYRCC
jgi:hypothetical protein